MEGITGTWTPECLARVDLISWDPKGIPNRSTKMGSGIVHHKSDRKSCVLPTADRNTRGGDNFLWVKERDLGTKFFFPAREGTSFFPVAQRVGTTMFSSRQRRDQKKLATGHHEQTVPPPSKNNISLNVSFEADTQKK